MWRVDRLACVRVTLLGTGGPRPDPDRAGPATLVQHGGLNLLFDAGRGVAQQLAKAGVELPDLDAVFITHHHFDHTGGLGDLLMAAWNLGRDTSLQLFGPIGTEETARALLERVYWRDISYRIAEEKAMGRILEHPSEMLEVSDVVDGVVDLAEGTSVTVGEVEHGGSALGLSAEDWTAVGYRVQVGSKSVAISGDAVAGRALDTLAADVNALVMCAYLAQSEIVDRYGRFLVDNVIAGAPQAAAIAAQARAGRLLLTHIRQKSPEDLERMLSETAAAFPGEVIVGHDLLSIDL